MRVTIRKLAAFAIASTLLGAGSCDPARSFSETRREVCETWGEGLFRPSRTDTEATAVGLTLQYGDHSAACPGIAQAQEPRMAPRKEITQ